MRQAMEKLSGARNYLMSEKSFFFGYLHNPAGRALILAA
jgi:hypothetical protein